MKQGRYKVVKKLMEEKHQQDLEGMKITDKQFKVLDMFFRVKPMMFFVRIDEKSITEVLEKPFLTFSHALSISKEFVKCGLLVSKKEGRMVIYKHTPKGKKVKDAVELILTIGIKAGKDENTGQDI